MSAPGFVAPLGQAAARYLGHAASQFIAQMLRDWLRDRRRHWDGAPVGKSPAAWHEEGWTKCPTPNCSFNDYTKVTSFSQTICTSFGTCPSGQVISGNEPPVATHRKVIFWYPSNVVFGQQRYWIVRQYVKPTGDPTVKPWYGEGPLAIGEELLSPDEWDSPIEIPQQIEPLLTPPNRWVTPTPVPYRYVPDLPPYYWPGFPAETPSDVPIRGPITRPPWHDPFPTPTPTPTPVPGVDPVPEPEPVNHPVFGWVLLIPNLEFTPQTQEKAWKAPTYRQAPPRLKDREGKLQITRAVAAAGAQVGDVFNAFTEFNDFISVLWNALPEWIIKAERRKRKGKEPGLSTKLEHLVRYWRGLDLEKAVNNFLEDQLKDFSFGLAGHYNKKAAQKHGWHRGPMMKPIKF